MTKYICQAISLNLNEQLQTVWQTHTMTITTMTYDHNHTQLSAVTVNDNCIIMTYYCVFLVPDN